MEVGDRDINEWLIEQNDLKTATKWSSSKNLLNCKLIDKHVIIQECKFSLRDRKAYVRTCVDDWRKKNSITLTSS